MESLMSLSGMIIFVFIVSIIYCKVSNYFMRYLLPATTTECYDCTTTSKTHSLIHPFMFLPMSK